MLQESPEKLDSKQERVLLTIIVSRHGPKASASGEKNKTAEYFNESVRGGFGRFGITPGGDGLVRIASSPVQRAVDTANIYMDELLAIRQSGSNHIPTKDSLVTSYQPRSETSHDAYADDFETLVKMQKGFEPEARETVEKNYADKTTIEKEAEVRNLIDMHVLTELFTDSKREAENKKFKVPYEEVADLFASRYKGFLRHTDLLEKMKDLGPQPEKEPYIQVDVSHSFPVTCFLKEYLVFEDGTRARDLSPGDFFNRTGGIIRESGSFQMKYLYDDRGGLEVEGEFEPGHPFKGRVIFE